MSKHQRVLAYAIALAIVAGTTACSAQSESTNEQRSDAPLTRATPASPHAQVPASVMERVHAELALDSDAADTAQLVRSESVIFNDGSLGCPEPSMSYTMATVSGYRIVFDVAGESFDYRVNAQGAARRCIDGPEHAE